MEDPLPGYLEIKHPEMPSAEDHAYAEALASGQLDALCPGGIHQWPRTVRINPATGATATVELYCPICKQRIICLETELHCSLDTHRPNCARCSKPGDWKPFQVKRYSSGPIDLNL